MGNIKLLETEVELHGLNGFKIILAYTVGLICIVAGIIVVLT